MKDLAMLDYLRCDVELKALRYDERYNEVEKETIRKYLEGRKTISNQLDKKNLKPQSNETTPGISSH